MSKSSLSVNQKYKEISKELSNREKVCNKKVVYEYKRPKTNPYETYEDIDDFVTKEPFNIDSSCKIVDDDKSKPDKYNRFYRNVYTKARCHNAKGEWDKKTINRNNTYDMGNCWVDDNDRRCGALLSDFKLLRENDHKSGKITKQDIKKSQKLCETVDSCHLQRVGENSIDCVSKTKIPEKSKSFKSFKSSSSNNSSYSRSSSESGIYDIDFNNIEKSLYDLYNSANAPNTLKLIGKGNRCINTNDEEEDEEQEEVKMDELDQYMLVKINEKEKPPLANLELDKNIMSIKNYLISYYNNYLRYIHYILISLDLDFSNDLEILKLYINDGSMANIEKFKVELKGYINYYRHNYYKSEDDIEFVAPIYEKYFKRYFLNKETNNEIVIKYNYEFIQELFQLAFIRTLNPMLDEDIPIIKFYIEQSYITDADNIFLIFKKNFNDVYPKLMALIEQYKRTPTAINYNNIIVLRTQLGEYYTSAFIEYFDDGIKAEINGYRRIYIRYVRYLLSFNDPTDNNNINFFLQHIDINTIDRFNEFLYEYNYLVKNKRIADVNEYFKVYKKYFPDYFKFDDIYQYNSYVKTKLKQLDPNINDDLAELNKYIDKTADINEFKRLYNLIDKAINPENYELNLDRLYRKFFPVYYEDLSKSLSSSSPSITSSIKSYGPLYSSSTDYYSLSSYSSLSSSIEIPKNPKLPTTPQSIINNICKTIHKNKLNKRGMLIWHSTGSGKTCTATSIMEGFWGTKQQIIYCSSRDALVSNPPSNFFKCAADLFPRFAGKELNKIEKEFKNVSFLSFAQLSNRIEKKVIDLNKCILIIDEVHNLFRPLLNQRKQHEKVEKLLLSGSKFPKMKVFILTATLGDNPIEIFKLLNIVRDNGTPEIKETDMNDIDKFKLKIRGLISFFDMSNDTSKFPVVINKDPIYVNMSEKQFEEYITKYNEVKDSAKDFNALSKANTLNKYWAAARRYSNTLYNFEKGLTLREFSAKLEELLLNVLQYNDQKQYIYSAFYENKGYGGHGVLAIAKQLNERGYTKLTPAEAVKIMENPTEANKKPRYILAISTQLGTDKGADLDKLRALYNAPYNKNGEYVHLFLASQSYNEGIDLKAVRHIHIFEPLITWASDKQTIGRAARLCSHVDLEKKDWNVTIHRYISDFPKKEIKIDKTGIDNKAQLLDELILLETREEKFKGDIKENKEVIKDIKKQITKANKAKQSISELEYQVEDANNIIEMSKIELENIKKEIKTIKAELKKYEKSEMGTSRRKKKILDTTGIENIDKFIYDNAISKMQNILTLYQAMKEAAIDCQVLKEFHSSGNQIINCQNY